MQGPVLNALYLEADYNGRNNSRLAEKGLVLSAHHLVGPPRLRQVRVRNGSYVPVCASWRDRCQGHLRWGNVAFPFPAWCFLCRCEVATALRPYIRRCVAAYSASAEDTEPFGGPTGDAFFYSTAEALAEVSYSTCFM